MTLPPLLLLTDRALAAARGRSLPDVVAAAVDTGARAVVLREKDLPRAHREVLARELSAVLTPVGGLLLAASDAELCPDGVHLAAGDPMPALRADAALVGRSCHDAAELATAAEEGCSYATLSPVAVTASKPGYGPALGLDRFAELVAGAALPVYALGGVDPALARQCRDAGASGVAVMGAVMGAADPRAVVAELLDAWALVA